MQASNNTFIYENDVPLHLGHAIDKLYGSLYSSLSYLRYKDDLNKFNTYVAHDQAGVSAILMFTMENGMIRVVNEEIRLQASEIVEFARFIFENYPQASAITFHAVQIDGESLPFFHQGFFCGEDFIVELPESPEKYLASLGNSTRKTMKWSKNRVERAFPSFSHQVYERENIRDEDVRSIIEMNRARMSVKGKVAHIDEENEEEILRLAKACGMVCVATIEGNVCAGTISYAIGDSIISWVNAHDPQYDDYRLGILCNYLAVCASIERGAHRFHLGHTKYDYKKSLLGKFQPYEHLVLYRSQLHFLLNFHHAIKVAANGYRLIFNRKLLEGAESEKGIHWEMARKGLKLWRHLKNKSIPDDSLERQ